MAMYTELQPSPQTVLQEAFPGEPLQMATTLSAPFSGSTLFAILLARHAQLSSDGETFPQGDDYPIACSCGQLQIDCPYYRQVAAHMLSSDGKSWNMDLFTTHPVYSRSAMLDSIVGRLWPYAPLRLAQDVLRSSLPGLRRQDRAFVDAHLQLMENSLRMRQARVYVDGCKSIRRAMLFAGSRAAR